MSPGSVESPTGDLEKCETEDDTFKNDSVKSLAWKDLSVTVRDSKTGNPRSILQKTSGAVFPGTYSGVLDKSWEMH